MKNINHRKMRDAQHLVYNHAIKTPLIRYQGQSKAEIYLKLETLQPIGSFKIRGASAAIQTIPHGELETGVLTASAGNMAQGLAFIARKLNIPCNVVVPEHASAAKLQAIEALGANYRKVPFEQWWETLTARAFPGLQGTFIHPVSDSAVIAGNSTVGLEIMEQLPEVDTIITPFGGGGLTCGVSAACQTQGRDIAVKACEVSTAAPLHAALNNGAPVEIDFQTSFVDGIGSRSILAEMWPLIIDAVSESLVVTPDEIKCAVVLLARHANTVAEGAAAASLAAALKYGKPEEKIVCVVTGGNINTDLLGNILLNDG